MGADRKEPCWTDASILSVSDEDGLSPTLDSSWQSPRRKAGIQANAGQCKADLLVPHLLVCGFPLRSLQTCQLQCLTLTFGGSTRVDRSPLSKWKNTAAFLRAHNLILLSCQRFFKKNQTISPLKYCVF